MLLTHLNHLKIHPSMSDNYYWGFSLSEIVVTNLPHLPLFVSNVDHIITDADELVTHRKWKNTLTGATTTTFVL